MLRSGVYGPALVAGLGLLVSIATAQANRNDQFVQRNGTQLTLGGEAFRYSGPNVEWLGIEAYGPHDPMGPRYPSKLEIDDALDTAQMMGARVVRSQTMGDSVACDLCIEPRAHVFNPEAFKSIDYAIKGAHERGMRVIITLAGDCANCELSGPGQYLLWKGERDFNKFFTDPAIIAEFEEHIRALLTHTNTLTGIAYKDDPTILAWENCNMCGLGLVLGVPGKDLTADLPWIDTIGSFIKSIDHQHLYEDNSGLFAFDNKALDAKTTDIVTFEYYPHWDAFLGTGQKTTSETFTKHAEMINAKGKVYVVNEYGWDATNWHTQDDFAAVLKVFETDSRIVGDNYWALQAHADKFGWQPISAPTSNTVYAKMGESGNWWSMFYGGMTTMDNSKADMQARAEQLRTHAYAMAGVAPPPHPVPASPVITFKSWGLLAWRGVAGAVTYSVQRRASDSADWVTVCDKCATDTDTPWMDARPGATAATKYRVIAYNADGKESEPSAER